MADDNISADGTAEAVLYEVDAPEFDAEATDDGTDATQEPAEQSPGSEIEELTDAQITALAEQATMGIFPKEPDQEDDESAEEDATQEDEPEDAAQAAPTGKTPARISVKHLGDEAALVVKAGDISRKEKISFAEAAKRVGLFKAEQSAEGSTAATPEAQIDNGQGTRDFAAELAEAEAAIEAAEAEEAEALTSFDKDRIAAAKKAVRLATNKATVLERVKEQSEAAGKQALSAEMTGLRSQFTELSSPDSPLAAAFNDLVDTLPDNRIGPGKMGAVMRMAWAATYPDKPYPVAKAAAKTVTPVIPPKKNGTPIAALGANGRPAQPRGLAAVIRNPAVIKKLSDAELEAALNED
jgi:hypothetical protein